MKRDTNQHAMEQRARAVALLYARGHRAEAFSLAFDRGDRSLLDAEVSEADEEALEQWLSGIRLRKRANLLRLLRTRIRLVGWVLASFLVVFASWLGIHRATTVRASNSLEDFEPQRAVDGLIDSEWLLPEGEDGWLEVPLLTAREIRHVHLLNAYNLPHNDRGTREYELILYRNGESVATARGEFQRPLQPSYVTHEFDSVAVDTLRFVVLSHVHRGAGLAEIHVE